MKELALEDILCEACELPESEWEAYLDRVCRGNKDLMQEAHSLLRAHASAENFMNGPTDRIDLDGSSISSFDQEQQPRQIGRYKTLEKIGEGGFGVVFKAEQVEPVVRRVALKIIKAGMDTRRVVARFEAERQALALMSHPNIARVLDGGATENGRPYFVMELVPGTNITNFCQDNRLSMTDRLQLVRDVCDAVQHAHQKGIIHRDLKPSNILVTKIDGRFVPKVIDFGIAKAMHFRLTDKTLYTEMRQMIGTPQYMSPEQVSNPNEVDTRTDIYALGVILYELLTGSHPYPVEGSMDEVFRHIKETPPTPPSSIWTTEFGQFMQPKGGVSPTRCPLDHDVETILLKALDKDPARRYDSARQLSEDIRRHLVDEPIEAKRDSLSYVFLKACKRNRRKLVGVFSVAFIIAMAYGVGYALGAPARAEELRLKELRLEARANNIQSIKDLNLRNYDKSIELLRLAIASVPDYGASYGNLSKTLKEKYKATDPNEVEIRSSLIDEAIDMGHEAMTLQPDRDNPCNTKAVCHMLRNEEGDVALAWDALNEALARNVDAVYPQITRAKLAFLGGQLADGVAVVEELEELAQDKDFWMSDPWLAVAIGYLYFDDERCVSAVQTALSHNRSIAAAHQVWALIHLRLENRIDVQEALEAAITADRTSDIVDPRIKRLVAEARLRTEDYEGAVAAAREAIDASDRHAELAHLIASIAYAKLGRLDAANEHYQKAIEFDVHHADENGRMVNVDLELLWFESVSQFEQLKTEAVQVMDDISATGN